jgi:hypothetical protein
MPQESPTFRFRSDLFRIDLQEDAETNPFCYGKALAEWIRTKFGELGYQPELAIAEDWGWCVMLKRDPFPLWIGCGNERSEFYGSVTPDQKESFALDGREMMWSCLVGTDAPIWTSFFWKRLIGRASSREQVRFVTQQLQAVLANEPRIKVAAEDAA